MQLTLSTPVDLALVFIAPSESLKVLCCKVPYLHAPLARTGLAHSERREPLEHGVFELLVGILNTTRSRAQCEGLSFRLGSGKGDHRARRLAHSRHDSESGALRLRT